MISGMPKRATAPKADRSVLVVLDVEALGGALTEGGVALVGAEGGLRVGLAPHQERRPGLLLVLRLAGQAVLLGLHVDDVRPEVVPGGDNGEEEESDSPPDGGGRRGHG